MPATAPLAPTAARQFFEGSPYNHGALSKGAVCPRNQLQISAWIAARLGSPRVLVDICCGGGWTAIRLARRLPSLERICFIDFSANQLAIARGLHASRLPGHAAQASFVVADARRLPLPAAGCDVITWACAVHLFALQEVAQIADDAWPALRAGGSLAVVTFDRDDIGQSLCDQHVEGYAALDHGRYHACGELVEALSLRGRYRVTARHFSAEQHFSGSREAVRLLRGRSFSTFALMDAAFGAGETDRRIEAAAARIHERFGNRRIALPQRTLVLHCEKAR